MKVSFALAGCKRHLARLHFRHVGSRQAFPLLTGTTLLNLRKVVGTCVAFPDSICNAGLVREDSGYTCVAKNQRFSYCNELGIASRRRTVHIDDGVRVLYRIDFDHQWRLKSLRKLTVVLDGELADPAVFIEDVRLVRYGRVIMAMANGNGAWPLLGTLANDTLLLRSAVAEYSAPQKNWMPFECGGDLFLEYAIQPHVLLGFRLESAECVELHRTTLESDALPQNLHGGAPPLRLNADFFLGVGNSQHLYWFQDRYYAAVFYLFEAKPPFRVVKVSPPLRVQSRFERIQYICGMALSEDNQSLILSIGICDCDNQFVLVPLVHILAHLRDQPRIVQPG